MNTSLHTHLLGVARTTIKTLSIPALAVSLIACGGGSDGGGGGGGSSVEISAGAAVKGIIQKGAVEVCEFITGDAPDDNGNCASNQRRVGTAETDDAGQYSMTLDESYEGGVLEVKILPGAETKIICDDQARNCGVDGGPSSISPDASFILRAILAGQADGADLTSPVTPLTHLAAARFDVLVGNGEDLTAAANAANTGLSNLLGMNIQAQLPVDITASDIEVDDGDQLAVTAFIAAVADIIYASGGSLDNLAAEYAGTAATSAGFESATFDALIENAESQIEQADLAEGEEHEQAAANARVDNVEASAENNQSASGRVEATPTSEDENTSGIDKGRALLQNVRTFFYEFENFEDPAEAALDEAGEEADGIVKMIEPLLDNDVNDALEVVAELSGDLVDQIIEAEDRTQTITQTDSGITGTIKEDSNGDVQLALTGTHTGSGTVVDLAASAPYYSEEESDISESSFDRSTLTISFEGEVVASAPASAGEQCASSEDAHENDTPAGYQGDGCGAGTLTLTLEELALVARLTTGALEDEDGAEQMQKTEGQSSAEEDEEAFVKRLTGASFAAHVKGEHSYKDYMASIEAELRLDVEVSNVDFCEEDGDQPTQPGQEPAEEDDCISAVPVSAELAGRAKLGEREGGFEISVAADKSEIVNYDPNQDYSESNQFGAGFSVTLDGDLIDVPKVVITWVTDIEGYNLEQNSPEGQSTLIISRDDDSVKVEVQNTTRSGENEADEGESSFMGSVTITGVSGATLTVDSFADGSGDIFYTGDVIVDGSVVGELQDTDRGVYIEWSDGRFESVF